MKTPIRILIICLALCCTLAAEGASVWDDVASDFFEEDYHYANLEGVWQFPDDGATLLIKQTAPATYQIWLLDSPYAEIESPLLIGKAVDAPAKSTFNARLSSASLADKRLKDHDVKLTISENAMLSFSPYHHKLKLHLRRWVPYFFRVGIERGDMPDNLIGARRLFPLTPFNYKPCL